jgi:SIR2-like domain
VEQADQTHYLKVAEKLAGGRMIPFLGAGANLIDRGDEEWQQGADFLPNGYELAKYLAQRGLYPPLPEGSLPRELNLLRVAEYVSAAGDEADLYKYLHDVFGLEYSPTSLHCFLARTAKSLKESGLPQLLVVTTNYDDLVERAFDDEDLEFDVIWYEARQNAETRGRFVHRPPSGKPRVIARPNKYTGLPLELERPAVLKLHGCLNRDSADDDSYVITEDSYIDYLSGGDVGAVIPIALSQRLTGNSLLFLGYSLSDWNLRVILNRIWGARKLQVKSWAVQREPADPDYSKIERALWEVRENVELVYCELREYVQELDARLPGAMPARGS